MFIKKRRALLTSLGMITIFIFTVVLIFTLSLDLTIKKDQFIFGFISFVAGGSGLVGFTLAKLTIQNWKKLR